MNTASCLYEGAVRHRRVEPRREFRHRLALAYLDLAELPGLLDGRLLEARPGVVRFRRADYLGDVRLPLDRAVRDLAEERIGWRPSGPIRLLTHLRSFGHCFNPVSFYYCFGADGSQLEAVLAEVTNTPWGERHVYAIPHGRGTFTKALHVSPFLAMEHVYACRASVPGETLAVHIESCQDGVRVFDATLTLRRRELTRGSLRSATLRYPLATMRVLALIYMHALALRLTGVPVLPHPQRTRT